MSPHPHSLCQGEGRRQVCCQLQSQALCWGTWLISLFAVFEHIYNVKSNFKDKDIQWIDCIKRKILPSVFSITIIHCYSHSFTVQLSPTAHESTKFNLCGTILLDKRRKHSGIETYSFTYDYNCISLTIFVNSCCQELIYHNRHLVPLALRSVALNLHFQSVLRERDPGCHARSVSVVVTVLPRHDGSNCRLPKQRDIMCNLWVQQGRRRHSYTAHSTYKLYIRKYIFFSNSFHCWKIQTGSPL